MEKHHILFPRIYWQSDERAKKLRANSGLIAVMDSVEHAQLHSSLELVPIPDYHMLRRLQRDFDPGRDPIESINNLKIAVSEAMSNPRASEVSFSLGQLIIDSLDIQIPFIERGIRG